MTHDIQYRALLQAVEEIVGDYYGDDAGDMTFEHQILARAAEIAATLPQAFSPQDTPQAVQVTDAMLERACAAYDSCGAPVFKIQEAMYFRMRAAIEAALAAQPQTTLPNTDTLPMSAQPPQESLCPHGYPQTVRCSRCGDEMIEPTEFDRVMDSVRAYGEKCIEYGKSLAAQPPAQSQACEPVAWQCRYIDPVEGPGLWHELRQQDRAVIETHPEYEVRTLCVCPPAPSPASAQRNWPDDDELYSCQCSHCGNEFLGHKRRVVCHACAPCGEELARLRLAASSQRALVEAGKACAESLRTVLKSAHFPFLDMVEKNTVIGGAVSSLARYDTAALDAAGRGEG